MSKIQNITAAWNSAHAHLQPHAEHLALPPGNETACPLCGEARAFHVRARLRFGAARWVEDGQPLYCPGCRQYTVTETSDETVTAVDARLWSAHPEVLNIEPTTRCNFKCWYCVGRTMKQQDIRVEDFAAALANFPGIKTIALVGEGEPLVNKDFFAMANMARDRGIRVVIISNGSAFSQSVVEQICAAEIAYIGISIDSADPATFARSRIDGDLEKIWRGIERLRRYRDEHGYRYPKLGLKGTLFSYSENEMPSIVAAAKEHGIEVFEAFQALNRMQTYLPIYPAQEGKELQSAERVAQAIARDSVNAIEHLEPVLDFCRREAIEVNNDGTPNGLRNNCDEKWIYSLLSGDVTPCCQLKTPMDEQWNLFRHPIDKILSNPHYENVRFNLWNGLFPSYCQGCGKTR